MKTYRLSVLFLVVLVLTSCALPGTMPLEIDKQVKDMLPPEGKALVYIVRPATIGFAVRNEVLCDGRWIGTTGAQNYIYTIVDPGSHDFINIPYVSSTAGDTSELTLVCKAGKIYFLDQQVKLATKLVQLDDVEGRKKLSKCSLSNAHIAPDFMGYTTKIPKNAQGVFVPLTTEKYPPTTQVKIVFDETEIPGSYIEIATLKDLWREYTIDADIRPTDTEPASTAITGTFSNAFFGGQPMERYLVRARLSKYLFSQAKQLGANAILVKQATKNSGGTSSMPLITTSEGFTSYQDTTETVYSIEAVAIRYVEDK